MAHSSKKKSMPKEIQLTKKLERNAKRFGDHVCLLAKQIEKKRK